MKKNHSNQLRSLLIALLPIQALAFGLPAINSLLNGFVVGRYLGATALAAIGFAAPLNHIITLISSTLANGSQIKSGQCLGRGDQNALACAFNTTLSYALASGLVITAVLGLFRGSVSALLGVSDELMQMTQSYILGLAPSVFLNVLFSCLLSFLQLERAEKVSTTSVVVMLVVNTGFNFLNIFVLRWGLFGAGLSTSLANFAAVLVCIPYFLRKSPSFHFSPRKFSFGMLKDVLYLGFPSAVTPACSFFRDRVLNHFVFLLGGTPAMAALSVASNLMSAVGCTIEGGYSGSANLLSSVLVGERDVESLRALPKTLITTMLPIYSAAYLLLFAFARPIALLFGAAPEHVSLYVIAIRCINLWYLSNVLKTPSVAIYRSLGKVKLVSILYVLNIFVYPCLDFLVGRYLGLGVIYAYGVVSEMLLIVTYVVYYFIRRRKMPNSVCHLTDIPHTLAVPSADRFNMTIENIAEATKASADVIEFCNAKGIPAKTANMCGLCVEEMAVDTILHGFSTDQKRKNSIELRVIYEDARISILLRDNCAQFDPKEWLALYADNDPDRSMGIRLVAECAREMSYTSTLGLNVIYIRL